MKLDFKLFTSYLPLLLAVLFSALSVMSYFEEPTIYDPFDRVTYTEGDFEILIDDDEVSLISYHGKGGLVDVPSAVNGYTITILDSTAFNGNNTIVEIILPDTITEIEYRSFKNCDNLQKVRLPESLNQLKDSVFEECTQLKEVLFGSDLKTIGRKAFYGCSSLESIDIPKSVHYIDYAAFGYCSSLSKINIDSSSTDYVFVDGVLLDIENNIVHTYLHSNTQKEYAVPEGIVAIGEWAFWYNTSLEKVVLPNSLKSIERGAFAWCEKLHDVNMPEGLARFESNAFLLNTSLENMYVPSSVISFRGAFALCDNVTLTVLKDSEAHQSLLQWGWDSNKFIIREEE